MQEKTKPELQEGMIYEGKDICNAFDGLLSHFCPTFVPPERIEWNYEYDSFTVFIERRIRMPDDNKPVDNRLLNEWFAMFQRLALENTDIDLTKKEDLGRLLAFVQTGESEEVEHGTGNIIRLPVGEMRAACLPQDEHGYKDLPEDKTADNDWILDHLKGGISDAQKQSLFAASQAGKLVLQDLHGRLFQVSLMNDGYLHFTDLYQNEAIMEKPEKPVPPKKPLEPGGWVRFWYGITHGHLFKDAFQKYDRKRIAYQKDLAHYKTFEMSDYRSRVREYELQTVRRDILLNHTMQGISNGMSGKDVLRERSMDLTYWAVAHRYPAGVKEIMHAKQTTDDDLSALGAEAEKIDHRIEKVLGPVFSDLPELTDGEPVYVKGTLNPKPFDPELVAGSGLTGREIGYLSLAAFADPKFSAAIAPKDVIFRDPLHLAVNNYYMAVDGIFTQRRKGIGDAYGPKLLEARSSAEDALRKFLGGDPKPLGVLLATGIRMQEKEVRSAAGLHGFLSQFSHIARRTIELLDDHPELMKAAKTAGGLTDQELITARGVANMERVEVDGRKAQKTLIDDTLKAIAPDIPWKEDRNPWAVVKDHETCYKEVQRMQAVNFSVTNWHYQHFDRSELLEARENRYAGMTEPDPKKLAEIMGQNLSDECNIPLNSLYASFGSKTAMKDTLDQVKMTQDEKNLLHGNLGTEPAFSLITALTRQTELMPEVQYLLKKSDAPELAKANETASTLQNGRQLQNQPVSASAEKASAPAEPGLR